MAVHPTGNAHVDSILWGGWRWNIDPVAYFFSDDHVAWSPVERAAYRAALDAWSSVADIDFVEVGTRAAANFIEYTQTDATLGGVLGRHFTPEHAVGGQVEGFYNYEQYGGPAFGFTPRWYPAGLAAGAYGYTTILHELGHALGLAHPHDDGGDSPLMPGVTTAFNDYGDNNLNQNLFTVMSYNRGWDAVQDPNGHGIADFGYNIGPGALDIAAVQWLYGANMTAHAGNTVYTMSDTMGWLSIWDTGGIDTIRYGGSEHAVIDLTSATIDNSATGGGVPSYVRGPGNYGGFTIAGDFTNVLGNVGTETGVIIENAIGGSGNDRITGNGVRNILRGNNGNDAIIGHEGHDALLGGRGHDRLYGGANNDLLSGDLGNDMLSGGGGRDRMAGHNGADRMYGSAGNDVLNGGAGSDLYVGGGGIDWFMFRDNNDHDQIRDFIDNVDLLLLDEALWGGGLTINQVVAQFATDIGTDILFDFGGGNTILLEDVHARGQLVDDIVFI